MKKNNKILLLVFFLLISFIIYKIVYEYKDNFSFGVMKLGEYDANLDGKQAFPYINDSNHYNNTINNYYLNDDAKINDTRVVQHKYQIRKGKYYGSTIPTTTKYIPTFFDFSLLSIFRGLPMPIPITTKDQSNNIIITD
jgi:hypothetical protein